MSIDWAGQTLRLLPERAMLWVQTATLILSDTHFGKAAAFRRAGIPVPEAASIATVDRLSRIMCRTSCVRVVIVGDFYHARAGRTPETDALLERWRGAFPQVEMILVRGNHDRRSGDPPADLRIVSVDEWRQPPFLFRHEPDRHDDSDAMHAVCGHIHPAVSLHDRGGLMLRLPCFLFQRRVALLPAFGDFTGMRRVRPNPEDRVFAIADDEVIGL